MSCVQYDLFDVSEDDARDREIARLNTSLEKLRRAMWVQNNETKKIVMDFAARVEIMEKNICARRA